MAELPLNVACSEGLSRRLFGTLTRSFAVCKDVGDHEIILKRGDQPDDAVFNLNSSVPPDGKQ